VSAVWNTRAKFVIGPVNRVVHPAAALLDSNATPLGLRQKPVAGKSLRQFLRQDDMPASRHLVNKPSASRGGAGGGAAAANLYSWVSSTYFSEYSIRLRTNSTHYTYESGRALPTWPCRASFKSKDALARPVCGLCPLSAAQLERRRGIQGL
jgi:hypothetical protein